MGRGVLPRNSFVAGVLSPRLEGRSDLKQYSQGCRQIVNGISRPHGGVFRRLGTVFMGSGKYPGKAVRLIPFEVSTDQAYLIEAGDFYFRFWTIRGLVLAPGGGILEVETPYGEGDLALLQKSQDADVAVFAHPSYPPQKLSRTAANAFDLAEVEFNNGRAPVRPFNSDANNTCTISGTWPDIKLTFALPALDAGADIGRAVYVRDIKNKRAVYARITAVTSTTVAQAAGLYRTPSTAVPAATDRWALGLFATSQGCNAVAHHEGRLWYAGFTGYPDLVVSSVSGEFDNFELENPESAVGDAAEDDKSIQRRVVSGGQVSTVLWMRSVAETLVVGTAGAEFLFRASKSILTPTDAAVKAATSRGSSQASPTGVDAQLFFIQKGGRRIRQLAYALQSDGFQSEDVSVLAEHLTRRGVSELVYQQEPDSVLWVRTADGRKLLGWTVERSQDVTGAHTHELGGVYAGGAPQIDSIAVLAGASAGLPTSIATGLDAPVAVGANMGFEAGAMTGWTTVAGTWSAVTNVSTAITAPQEGTYFAAPSAPDVGAVSVQRDIILSGLDGWSPALVTAGRTEVDLRAAMAWAASPSSSASVASVRIRALTSSDIDLGEVAAVSRPTADSATGVWTVYEQFARVLPDATSKLRVICQVVAGTGNAVAAGFDALGVTVRQRPLVTTAGSEQVEDSLWMVVRRRVNGSDRVMIERMAPSFTPDLTSRSTLFERRAAVEWGVFADCSLTFKDTIPISDISSSGPALITTEVPHSLSVGAKVMLRGVQFRAADGRTLDRESLNNTSYRVATVESTTAFTMTLPDGTTVLPPSGTFDPIATASVYREVSRISGLSHLEGEPVAVLANGRAVNGLKVTGGAIDLPFPASVVTVGLRYRFLVETMRFFGLGGRQGTDEGAPLLLSAVRMRMVDSIGGQLGMGPGVGYLEPLQYGQPGDPLDQPYALYSGDIRVQLKGSWADQPTLVLVHDDPYPCEWAAVYATAESNI